MIPKREVTILFDRCGGEGEPLPIDLARQVATALELEGNTVRFLAVDRLLPDVRDALAGDNSLIFTLMDTVNGSGTEVANLTALLDMPRLPYTGSDSLGILLSDDKALTKELLAAAGIPFPAFRLALRGSRLPEGVAEMLPAIVKPRRSDGSYGIDQGAVVTSLPQLVRRVEYVHHELAEDALVERYVEGREITVGVLGNNPAEVLCPVEVDLSGLPAGWHRVYSHDAKWNRRSEVFWATTAKPVTETDMYIDRVREVALAAFQAARLRDYGTVDIRLTDDGVPFVLEVNANCYLKQSGEFARGTAASGIDYPSLINRIAGLAIQRHQSTSTL